MVPSRPRLPHPPTLATFARPAPAYSSPFSFGLSCQFSPSSMNRVLPSFRILSLSLTVPPISPDVENPTTAK